MSKGAYKPIRGCSKYRLVSGILLQPRGPDCAGPLERVQYPRGGSQLFCRKHANERRALCAEDVAHGTRCPTFAPCSLSPIVTRGKFKYCRVHDPEAVERRNKARELRFQAEIARRVAPFTRIRALDMRIKALERVAAGLIKCHMDACDGRPDRHCRVLARARKLLRKER